MLNIFALPHNYVEVKQLVGVLSIAPGNRIHEMDLGQNLITEDHHFNIYHIQHTFTKTLSQL